MTTLAAVGVGIGVALVVAVAMEPWAQLLHGRVWHRALWSVHQSHHRRRAGRYELNDVLSAANAPIAAALGVQHLIAAVPEEDAQGNLTGKLLGVPTSGPGKVTHTHAWLDTLGRPLSSFGTSHFYSDSHNDLPLLEIVTHPVAVDPDERLRAVANERNWDVVQLHQQKAEPQMKAKR